MTAAAIAAVSADAIAAAVAVVAAARCVRSMLSCEGYFSRSGGLELACSSGPMVGARLTGPADFP